MGIVLDTSALVEVERGGADVVRRLGELGQETAVVPAIVYAELLVGVRLADSASRATARMARVEALIEHVPVVEFDREIARRWADLFADLTRSGTMLPANDLAVAATAIHLGFAVLISSKGEKHFDEVPGLHVSRLGSL